MMSTYATKLSAWRTLALSFLLCGLTVQAKAQQQCTVLHEENSVLQRGVNASCGMSSPAFTSFFSKNSNFRPFPGQNIAATTPKEIRIRAIVVQNTAYSTPQYTNNPTDISEITALLQDWVNPAWIPSYNGGFGNLLAPTKPNPSNCTTCHIVDSKFRVKLTGIDFITHNSTNYSSVINSYGTQKDDSVLNVFIVEHELNGAQATSGVNGWTTGGENFGLSTNPLASYNYIFLAGPKVNAWAAFPTFIHELGHMFGLWHLYDYNVGQSECERVGTSSPDWLSDIFPAGLCHINSSYNCDPTTDPNPLNINTCSGNFMGGGNRYFSPMQLGRMHRSAYMGSISRYIYPTEAHNTTPWEITSDQKWDFAIRMYQDIVVKAGKTLTITCEVQMPRDGRITVEKGAKLILDGGTITSYHKKAGWHGIQLYGNKTLQPYPQNQGSFEMKNKATIEYAYDGVQDFIDGVGQGGGIIAITNSTFKDCRRAIGLNDYPSYARGSSCTISRVEFLTEDPGAPTNANLNNFPMVSSYNERGVLITNCTFRNSIPMTTPYFSLSMRNNAIASQDAGFRIQNSSFKGYKEAIILGNYSNTPARYVKIMNCTFDSVNTGITFADNFSYAQDNTFDNLLNYVYEGTTIPYLYAGQAVYAENTGGLTLTRNTVLNSGNNTSLRGFTIKNSAATGGRVIDNIIENAKHGIMTQGNNPALDLLCNRFNSGEYNIVVNPESTWGVLKNQGSGCATNQYRAGNMFTGTVIQHIASYLTTPWTYYYWALPNQTPVYVSGTFTRTGCVGMDPIDPNSMCNLPQNIESNIDRILDEAFTSWAPPVVGPIALREAATFSAVVNHFNETGDIEGMVKFLEAIDHIESKKLLLPLYLDQENYAAFDRLLYSMRLPEKETRTYYDYYGLLKTLKMEDRSVRDLKPEELSRVREIAAGTSELSARASSLLAFAYNEPWHHYQEQMPAKLMSGTVASVSGAESLLSDAVPNPARGYATIEVTLQQKDAGNAVLQVRDMMGKLRSTHQLTAAGTQSIRVDLNDLPAGVYIYSLQVNGKILQSKRLVVMQ